MRAGWICERCRRPILPGEDYEVQDHSTSAAGRTIRLHKACPGSRTH